MTVPHTLTFDAAPSARSTDENGFLHVASSHITKATVNPYYGREIPGWREAGLDPEAVYYGFRDPEELKKSLSTWQGLPLHIEHHVDSAEEPARLTRVGAVGRADWNAPYVDAPLTVWDGEAIAAIEDGSFRELSCAYRYDPDFTPGRYEGVEYDFIMRNIRGNHVALVEEGRAGPDVVVADGALCGKSPEHVAYNLTREGSKNYADRQRKDPTGDSGKFCTRHASTHTGPTSGRPGTGAVSSFTQGIEHIMTQVNGRGMNQGQKKHTPKGAFMGKLKRWFRGAQDDNPEIEKQEVELAQAIIDLHKVDPVTGEIVDITEDEDKAEEIRRLIGELSAKLDPQEVKKLTDSLTDLACSRATGDERKTDAMDEEMKKAMDKCGLDAEDPTASQAFAEGVKYGEELERNPEERRRLDREHESEGMKKAMDACGLDAENPAESRAFAEGVKYGEELIRNPEERRKLDREHEREGERRELGKDEDKNAAITRILDDVPDLTPEQRKRLFDSLQDLAYSPATGDADPSEVKTAQDRAFRSPRHLTAMDAARIKASAIAEAQNHMRGLHQAVRDVRGLVGDLDPLSFDSASDVYGYALKQSGIDPRRYPRQAWRGMIDMLRAGKTAELSGGMARDAAPARLDGKFAGLNNISLAD